MVFGTGVDNVELSRIQKALTRSERFVEQVLTAVELEKYNSFQSTARKTEFLAGRWAAKEAFSKALGMHDLEIKNDELGKPFFTKHPFDGQVHLSSSHSNLEAVAFVVLEKN